MHGILSSFHIFQDSRILNHVDFHEFWHTYVTGSRAPSCASELVWLENRSGNFQVFSHSTKLGMPLNLHLTGLASRDGFD